MTIECDGEETDLIFQPSDRADGSMCHATQLVAQHQIPIATMAGEEPLSETQQAVQTEHVRINGVEYEATLEANGDLRWRSAEAIAGERRLSLDKEVLGIELRGTILVVRSFVEEIKEASCLGTRKQEVKRVRRDYVFELETEEKGMIWGDRLSACIGSLGRPKRLFIIVNPFGGKQCGRKIFANEVKPLLDAANILYTMQETNFQLHAQEIAGSLDVRKFDGIVCVSGDGVLVEVVNGLLQREDWNKAIKVPLGIIPAGSGNGMAKSLLDSGGEPCSISNAVFSVIRGNKRTLDVASVVQGETKFFSVLMLTWGLIADIDIESEKYRWMGSARFDFYSLLRIMNLRKYNGNAQFVPAPGYESVGVPLTQIEKSNQHDDPNLSSEMQISKVKTLQSKGYQGPSVSYDESHWRSIEGPFVYVWLNNVPWCSQDVMPAPEAKFSDGYLDAVIVRDCPRSVLLSLMLKMGDGTYVNSPYVTYLKVKAFQLVPGQRVGNPKKGGIVDVDGEVIARGDVNFSLHDADVKQKQKQYLMSYGPSIQISVDQGLATIFSPR
ncbi:Sphingosine kinase 1 [Rhynchospora pubera]|uniref:sphingosine kinase n=1 Tax=Rhynchospora pubera TaxID=906938 RepID=A0AAV8D363_9POAL|nr:Sphingosine kinase 1 [Rhynchospora pubera]